MDDTPVSEKLINLSECLHQREDNAERYKPKQQIPECV